MTSLLFVALLFGGANAALARRRVAGLVGFLMGAILMFVALFSAPLWNWGRVNSGAGLPPQYYADPDLANSAAATAFSWACLGCFLGGIVAALLTWQSGGQRARSFDLSITRLVNITSFALFVMWVLGQGPTIWIRLQYLDDGGGVAAFRNSTSLLGPLVGFAALVTSPESRTDRDRYLAYVMGAVWFYCTAALGSRISLLYVVGAFGLLAHWFLRERSWRSALALLAAVYPTVWAFLADFAITLQARSRPHGLALVFTNLASPFVPQFSDPEGWLPTVQRFASSIMASNVITEFSVAYHPGRTVLLVNANPMPSGLTSVDPFSAERFWPYEWIPLSFVGEWYGAMGPGLQVMLYAAIAGYAGVVVEAFRRRGVAIGAATAMALPLLATLVSIQYPSRMFWRLVSLVWMLPLMLPVLTMLFSRLSPRNGETHDGP